ncbi:two component regulator three Y motif protein [Clostridium zeae]|uniref:Two component regulator three Y motif protein n=1 Tax=Clostridium zeae TaxID=2759022 RepID=A0ABQ1ECF7_9CLOT|nr:triple tyrosine motif-containing protein [Clostridium zeae]GFZ32485.1 two component regulator three Y motif protein [Clostridium zeae]
MEELVLVFDKNSPQEKDAAINISIGNYSGEEYSFKFLVGKDGIWDEIKDFSKDTSCAWIPKNDGKYFIMVQVKKEGSKKPFDFIVRGDFLIGEKPENLIKDVYIENEEIEIGKKITIQVETNNSPSMYKYWISGKDGWELIKDYCTENTLSFTATEVGKHDILVECKVPDSKDNFDDFRTVSFKVKDIARPEIIDFKCLTSDLLVEEELIFQVYTRQDDTRTTLYKFLKINPEGKTICIQDYSSRRMVSFCEKVPGSYKILCLARDMYSEREYDDRAIIVYEVKPYHAINIKTFTTDLNSPQAEGSKILLRAVVEGGKHLLYKFKIDGNYGEDSGYIRTSSFLWEPKYEGQYRITLFVRDESFTGEYEDKKSLEFFVEKKRQKVVKITDVVVDRNNHYIINEPINIKVITEGGIDPKYSFVVYKDKKEKERVSYGNANWVNFTPEVSGEYELEIKVKDKYSDKEYDSHQFIYFNVKEYIEGNIDYVLLPSKEYYLIEDDVEFEVISQNTKDTLVKYAISIDGHTVEETDFITNKKFTFKPKRAGKYIVEMYAKNKKCIEGFDSKKTITIYVNEAPPVTGTKILCNKTYYKISDEININVESCGGKEVCYEFYLMEKGNWILVQKYSRKSYYTLMPFIEGSYRILVLAKSYYKKCAYEDYDIFEFKVEE